MVRVSSIIAAAASLFIAGCAITGVPATHDVPISPEIQCDPVALSDPAPASDAPLVFPGLLRRGAVQAGNPLAGYGAMRELEGQYLASPMFRAIYPEIRLNSEQFMGVVCAGPQAMRVIGAEESSDTARLGMLDTFAPRPALEVIRERAAATQLVIWGEEHHLPQTRSLYEPMLRILWEQGYRYLAAEAFEDASMEGFRAPDYQTGYYLRDPVFASAVRVAQDLGYVLVSYDTRERGEGASFRDVTQAKNIVEHVFQRDPAARVLILAGRGHASEAAASDGWTPMAHVLKQLTGIDPFTIFAPTMTERLTREEEDVLYRHATTRGLVSEPVIFEHPDQRRPLGSESFDAYVFFPRTRLIAGRPEWMVSTLGRIPVQIPDTLLRGSGMSLIQAFREGDSPTLVPVDQLLVDLGEPAAPHLMLPSGPHWVRAIDRDGNVVGPVELVARPVLSAQAMSTLLSAPLRFGEGQPAELNPKSGLHD